MSKSNDPHAMALACLAEIERLTAKIHEQAEAHVDGAASTAPWGHVGDLGRLVQGLRELAREEG